MIAALFVQRDGCYYGLPDVDPWDEERDARTYPGPHPVVAHPPCARWCQLAGLNEHRYGLKRGDDGGCFESALDSVRRWGGVLEHPAHTHAWAAFGLPRPHANGGWQRALLGGWVCHVEQSHWGHPARKATWLYAYDCELPSLPWGPGPEPTAWVSWMSPEDEPEGGIKRISKRAASATPTAFRDLLLDMARSVKRRAA